MQSKLYVKQYNLALCSFDGKEWYEVSEISALCCINNHYITDNLEAVLDHYNKGHIIPVEYILYKKKLNAKKF